MNFLGSGEGRDWEWWSSGGGGTRNGGGGGDSSICVPLVGHGFERSRFCLKRRHGFAFDSQYREPSASSGIRDRVTKLVAIDVTDVLSFEFCRPIPQLIFRVCGYIKYSITEFLLFSN